MGKSRRVKFQAILEDLMNGTGPVYFQAPPAEGMVYPCIIYERDNASTKHADNLPYTYTQRYQVTLIDRNPDSDVIDKLAQLPLSEFSRHFTTSGLNHDVFVIYY